MHKQQLYNNQFNMHKQQLFNNQYNMHKQLCNSQSNMHKQHQHNIYQLQQINLLQQQYL